MAGSRLEKIGTVFSRTSGMLRSGVLTIEEKPIWYEIYALHPPAEEPRYDRVAPTIEVKDIFYEEDEIRAKFHRQVKNIGTVYLGDRTQKSQTQKFIDIYTNLKAQGALDDEKIFEVSLKTLFSDKTSNKNEPIEDPYAEEIEEEIELGLAKSFAAAKKEKDADNDDDTSNKSKTKGRAVNIKSLFG